MRQGALRRGHRREHQQAFTLDERLHHAHEQFALLSEIFELQASVPEPLQAGALSGPASSALQRLCTHAARVFETSWTSYRQS